MTMTDILDLNRRAVQRSTEIVEQVRADDWDAPTPCSEWTLRRLVEHMTAQHHGFATAAEGEVADTRAWLEVPLQDPRRGYAESVERVLAAFAGDGVLEREFWLPEIHPKMRFPAARAIGFHFLDYVVHGWDVAAAIGIPAGYDTDLLERAEEVARTEVPEGPSRERPGAAFRPALAVSEQDSAEDRMLAVLGRDPKWSRR
ncbi:TIGR03086 family metal-binding protein [Streptomyces sp. NPDC051776]|uniref:TIGR03086 family metal-binding protein n=1 Tax=Streptomyces sp. NPDC051776 TaxID=3155414 RepID=UPI003424E7C8